MALFFGTFASIGVRLRNVPVLRHGKVFCEALFHIGCQHFINPVQRGSAVNMAGDLRNDLRRDGRCGGDGFWRLDLGITHLEAVGQHPFQVDQHAVEHGEEGGIIEIVIVDLAAFMRLNDVPGEDLLLRIVLRDDPGQQIALGGDHFAVFIGIFMQQGGVGLIHQTTNGVMQMAAALALHVAIVTILNIGACQLRVRPGHERFFHRILDVTDIHFLTMGQLSADPIGHRVAPPCIFHVCRPCRSLHCCGDTL